MDDASRGVAEAAIETTKQKLKDNGGMILHSDCVSYLMVYPLRASIVQSYIVTKNGDLPLLSPMQLVDFNNWNISKGEKGSPGIDINISF